MVVAGLSKFILDLPDICLVTILCLIITEIVLEMIPTRWLLVLGANEVNALYV